MASSPERSHSPPPTKKARLPDRGAFGDPAQGSGDHSEPAAKGLVSQDDHGSSWYLPPSESSRLNGRGPSIASGSSACSGGTVGPTRDSERDSGDSGFSEDGGATTPASAGEDECSQDTNSTVAPLLLPADASGTHGVGNIQQPTSFSSTNISFTFSTASSQCTSTQPSASMSLFGEAEPRTPEIPHPPTEEIELVPLDSAALDYHLPDSQDSHHHQTTANRVSQVTTKRSDHMASSSTEGASHHGGNHPSAGGQQSQTEALNTSQNSQSSSQDDRADTADDDDDDDNLSTVSGLSDLSGADWKPSGAGPFSWVQHHMMKGTDPRHLLKDMIAADTVIPDHLDQLTLWKIILNMLSEPPRRKKLPNINTIEDVVHLIAASRKIIVLTGAGVSVSCGIPDFRSRDGVYARLAVDFPDLPDPQAMFDINYFRKDPRPFFKFAREIYPGQFKPSPCHKFIRAIEKHGKLLRNYTQNIDTLEQVAGINRAVQCHGSFATATCTLCKYQVQADEIKEDIFQQRIPYCPKCNSLASRAAEEDRPALAPPANNPPSALTESPLSSKSDPNPSVHSSQSGPSSGPMENSTPTPPPGQATTSKGIMKPDIVFFGEGLGDEFHKSVAIDKHEADLLIMIGSSLKVRPVALIPSSVSPEVPQILINREPLNHLTPDVELLGDCDGIINQICLKLGQGWEEPVHGAELAETQELLQEEDQHHQEISPPSLGVKTDSENPTSIGGPQTSSTSNHPDGSDPKPSTSGDPSCHHDKEGRSQEEMEEERQRRIMAALWKPRKSIATQLKENSYFFKPPSRYIFPGAEVYPPRCDEGGDEGEDDSSSSSSDAGSSNGAGADSDDEGSAGEAAGAGGPPSQYGPQPATSPTSKETSAELNGDMAPNSQVGRPSPMTSEMAKEVVQ